jgi:hypothetical protein
MLIFNHSGSNLKHGEKKSGYVAHAQDFAPVDLQPLRIWPKAWRNKNMSMIVHMRRILLLLMSVCMILPLLIFSHSGYPA